jgi:hypothetical protein
MKKQFFSFICATLLFYSCSNNTAGTKNENTADNGSGINSDEEKTGEFRVNETRYAGPVSIQYFGSKEKGNFFVRCQQDTDDGKFALLQTTFLSETDALENPVHKIYAGAILPMTNPEPGLVTVTLHGNNENLGDKEYTGHSTSTGSITVKNRTLIIKDVTLFNSEGNRQVINASIPF